MQFAANNFASKETTLWKSGLQSGFIDFLQDQIKNDIFWVRVTVVGQWLTEEFKNMASRRISSKE